MLAFSPFLPSNLEWENTPLQISPNPTNFNDDNNNYNNNNSSSDLKSDYLGPLFLPSFQAPEGDYLEFQTSKFHQGDEEYQQLVDPVPGVGLGLEESVRAEKISTNSGHESRHEYSELAKKLSHNARERDRRKIMNASCSALRALLPGPPHQKEELSIPETISLVLDYIPELQKEVQNLIYMKQELESKISSLQEVRRKPCPQEEREIRSKRASLCAISVEKLGQREIVIHISTYEIALLPKVLLLLENYGLVVLNVSCFQCFGGRTFCNIYLWIEDATNNIVKWETLNEELLALFEEEAQVDGSKLVLLNKEEPKSGLVALDPYPIPWTHQPEPFGFYLWGVP